MQRLSFATVLAVGLVGCFQAPQPQVEQPTAEPLVETPVGDAPVVQLAPPAPPARQVPRVKATVDVNGGADRTFTIRDTPSLDFDVSVEHLHGGAVLGLVVLAPTGEPFAATQWQVDGTGEALRRTYSVPVSSTFIESYSLTGSWTTQLTLNGEVVDLIAVELQ